MTLHRFLYRRLLYFLVVLAALSLITGKSFAQQTSSVQVTNNPGDFITVVVQLHSTDPNENGEHEYWLVTSSGGELRKYYANYSSAGVFSFQADQANETVTLTSEADAVIITGVISDLPPDASYDGFSPPDHTGAVGADNLNEWLTLKLKSATLSQRLVLLGSGGAAVVPLIPLGATGAAALVQGLTGVFGSMIFLGTAIDKLARDPIDLNYTQIAVPVVLSLPPLTGTGLSQNSIAAFNALEANQEQMVAVALALYTTVNREAGARQANNSYWINQQAVAGKNFEGQLAALCATEIKDLTNLQNALMADGISINFTKYDVFNFEVQVGGPSVPPHPPALPAQMVTDLQTLGADTQTIADITNKVVVQDINAAAGNFPAILSSTDLIGALKDFSTGFGIPFASFTAAQLEVAPGSLSLGPSTRFSFGSGAPALDLSSQAFSLAVGPDVINIPPGSFHQQKTGNWVFEGPVGSVSAEARISSPAAGTYELQFEATNLDTSAISNPVTVKLTLGNSFGSASVNADITP
jgi:hypothetical protein